MHNFKIETTLPFPFLKLTELVTYTEVKKPTGVSYLLLVILKEAKDKKQKISDLLEIFGVPKVHHEIFAEELQKLISDNILIAKNPYNINYFHMYALSNFEFTEMGEKVFREEQIATGKEKSTKIDCYYDVAAKQLSMKTDPDLEVKMLYDNAFDNSFVLSFECEKDVESFFNLQKSSSFKVKPAEVITSVELIDKGCYVGKYPVQFVIDNDELKVKFNHNGIDDFFRKNYSIEIINKAISLKNKFKLLKSNEVKLSNLSSLNIYDAILPSEFNKLVKNNHDLIISRKDYNFNSNLLNVTDEEVIDNISKYVDFITIDNNKINAYCPVTLLLNLSDFGVVKLPLVLVVKPTFEEINGALEFLFNKYVKFNPESFAQLVKICILTNNKYKPIQEINKYMGNDLAENIQILTSVKVLISKNEYLKEEYFNLLKQNYYDYLNTVNEFSLETILKITNWIPSYLNIGDLDVLNLIEQKISSINNKVKLFEILSRYFNSDLIINYINPFNDIINGEISSNETLNNINVFNYSLNQLKSITGISNFIKYSFDEEKIDKMKFKEIYLVAQDKIKNIAVFRKTNKSYFEETDAFMRIFSKINDNFNMLDHAVKNPTKITKELIDKKINSGDYQFVLINLSTKLELILGLNYGCEGNLSDRLNQARKEKMIDKNIIADLHLLRENRNALVHPEDRKENFSSDDLRRWNDLVFSLEVQ
jgi:hypothetical protein